MTTVTRNLAAFKVAGGQVLGFAAAACAKIGRSAMSCTSGFRAGRERATVERQAADDGPALRRLRGRRGRAGASADAGDDRYHPGRRLPVLRERTVGRARRERVRPGNVHHDPGGRRGHDHAEALAAGTVRRNGIGRIERDDIPVDDAPELTSTAVGYGAWARYVAFDATIQETETSVGRIAAATASVGGIGNRSNPVGGSAEWSGAMVGLDYRDIAEQRFVQGDARVTADFADMDLDVALTGIAGVESGRFFGPDHEEVGGVFDRDGILGAFGAGRG